MTDMQRATVKFLLAAGFVWSYPRQGWVNTTVFIPADEISKIETAVDAAHLLIYGTINQLRS